MITPDEYAQKLDHLKTEVYNLQRQAQEAVKQRRLDLGYSLAKFAKHTGLSVSFVHQVTRYEKKILPETFRRLMK
jgi:hypothetical protein